MDAASKSMESCLTEDKAEHRYASYSPDGGKIIYESNLAGNWDIFVMNSDGSGKHALTSSLSDERRPSWHPSGKQILFESNRNGEDSLLELDLSSGAVKALEHFDSNLGTPMFARYSPDGLEIAVSLRQSDEQANIAILSDSGKLKQTVTDSELRNFYPGWSSDGSAIVFHSRMYSNNEDDEIITWSRASGELTRLTDWPSHNFCPAWSNDGARIAFAQSMPESRPEIFVITSDGSNKVRVTHNEDGDTLPSWSPDGQSLLITAYRKGHYQICSVTVPVVNN
ncbi:MAG: hypothetical protein AAF431_17435 [Pseudomonadota bacterium]